MTRYALALVAACALLAGCGATPRTGPTPPGIGPTPATADASANHGFNDTDIMFLQMMIPHHGQGLEIVRLAKKHPTRDDVRILAAAIEATQTTEVEVMAGWLRAWAKPATAPADAHAAHGGMPGTSVAEIAALTEVSDADFERKFLDMLIAHQDDAIQMARLETTSGINTPARNLARQIDLSRTAQIAQMLKYTGSR